MTSRSFDSRNASAPMAGILCGAGLIALAMQNDARAQAPAALGAEMTLSTANATSLGQSGVSLARAADGWMLAVWSDDRTGDHDVYGSLISPGGVPLTAPGGFVIAGGAGTHQGDPKVAACGNTFLVVWGDGWNDSNTTDIFATRVTTAGIVLDATPIIIANQPGVQHNFRGPASDGVDTFVVPFRTAVPSIFGGINTMRVSASMGVTLDAAGGAVLAAPTASLDLKKNPSAAFGAGRFFITWDDGRDLCTYPGEAGCIDIYGALIDPLTGAIDVPPFPTTRAFSCQEGSRAAFDGSNFIVLHSDERLTNCVTADLGGERVDPNGFVIDVVDPSGMIGGFDVATDPPGWPGTTQHNPAITALAGTALVTYVDRAAPPGQIALRIKRLDEDGMLEFGVTPAVPGQLIAQSNESNPMGGMRVEQQQTGPLSYLLAYTLDNQPRIRSATFPTPMLLNVLDGPRSSFNFPRGAAVDLDGRIIVADTENHRIVVFDADGGYLFDFGGIGTANGKFRQPFGVATGPNGQIYVADSGRARVQVFTPSGQFMFKFGAPGSGNGQFRWPYDVAVDNAGRIYVADSENHRVQVFSPTGGYLFKFGSQGLAPGQFRVARAIAVNASGTIFVADRDNNRVQYFDPNGAYQGRFASRTSVPRGLSIDMSGRVYVAESNARRISVHAPSGNGWIMQSRFGANGVQPGAFGFLPSVAVAPDGKIVAVDAGNHRVQLFRRLP